MGRDRLIAALAERQHGVVARRQLLEAGLGKGAIEARVQRAQLHLVHRGVYAVGYRHLGPDGRRMAAVLACGPGAVLSHRSAAEPWGIVRHGSGLPEVTGPSTRRRSGIVVHRGSVPADECSRVLDIPVTSLSRTLLDLASIGPRRQVERAWNEAEVKGLTDRLSVPLLLERYPRRRGSRVWRELLAAKEPGGISRNDFEELFVAFLDRHGLPRPRLNAAIWIRGRFIEADCMWQEERLLAELDGRATHGTERAFHSDRKRDRELLAEGWRSTRVTWWQLREEPEAVAADLRQVLRAPSPHPHPNDEEVRVTAGRERDRRERALP